VARELLRAGRRLGRSPGWSRSLGARLVAVVGCAVRAAARVRVQGVGQQGPVVLAAAPGAVRTGAEVAVFGKQRPHRGGGPGRDGRGRDGKQGTLGATGSRGGGLGGTGSRGGRRAGEGGWRP
jgi:hypothetical protein